MHTTPASNKIPNSFPILGLIEKCEQSLQQYWDKNPEIKHIVEQNKAQATADKLSKEITDENAKHINSSSTESESKSLFNTELRGRELREKIHTNHQIIKEKRSALNALVVPRTQAHNRKSDYTTVEEERNFREDVIASQIQAWRSLLPNLIKKLSKIPDPRRVKSVKHKVTVLMIFGLFAFIFVTIQL